LNKKTIRYKADGFFYSNILVLGKICKCWKGLLYFVRNDGNKRALPRTMIPQNKNNQLHRY